MPGGPVSWCRRLAVLALAASVVGAWLSIVKAQRAPAVQPPAAAPPPDAWPVSLVDVAATSGLVRTTVYGGVERKRFIVETNGPGIAFLDVDDDGWLDVFLLNGTRLEDGTRRERNWPAADAPITRLFLNQKNGTFRDVTAGSGLARTGWASGVCVGDHDDDGRRDLFVTYVGQNVLYRNLGAGRFADVTAEAGLPVGGRRWGSGCSFLDYDRDGRLDLFVANYLVFDLEHASEPGQGVNCLWKGIPVNCGPRGLPTDTNLLFRNTGEGRFADVSDPSGVSRVTGRYSMTAVATDFDGDGWVDVYVAADSTAAILYRNNRDGTFTDTAVESGAAFDAQGMAQAGMGVGVGDIDNDGVLDLVKTHFADDIPALYRGLGKGLFEDIAMMAGLGVQNRHVQWGTGMPDLDLDGWADIVYVTGSVYPEVEATLAQYPNRGPRVVFRNRGSARFEDVTARSGPATTATHSSRGAAFGDYDNDGDVDVVVMNLNERPSLLRNDQRTGHHWLTVRLLGAPGNRMGLGAVVRLTAGGRTQTRAVLSQSSYQSHDDVRAHFGLGTMTAVERIEVRWPRGRVETFRVPGVDRLLDLREGGGTPAPAAPGPR